MKQFTRKESVLTALAIIIIGAASRLLPHPPNFTPLGAMALLGGAYISKKHLAIILPLVVLFISDFILNNTISRAWVATGSEVVYFHSFMIYTYLGFIAITLLGFLFRSKRTMGNLFGLTIGSTLLFFLISNFGAWMSGFSFPMTPSGLLATYVAGIPFMFNSLLGNLVFVPVLFGAYHFVSSYKNENAEVIA